MIEERNQNRGRVDKYIKEAMGANRKIKKSLRDTVWVSPLDF